MKRRYMPGVKRQAYTAPAAAAAPISTGAPALSGGGVVRRGLEAAEGVASHLREGVARRTRQNPRGLPMDEASRMQRARDMGFDTASPVYRGTTANERAARIARDDDFPVPGISTTYDPATADFYARYGAHMAPEAMDGANVMKLFTRGERQDLLAFADEWEAASGRDWHDMTEASVRAFARGRGIGAVTTPENAEVRVLEPHNLRLSHATFDPQRSKSRDLLASGAGLLAAEQLLRPDGYALGGLLGDFADGGVVNMAGGGVVGGGYGEGGVVKRLARKAAKAAGLVDDPPMVALHNTRPERLERAEQVGGFAGPSLGITRADQPFHSFGDVSLVAPVEMIRPPRTPVYGSDAYTPRYPQVRYELGRREEDRLRAYLQRQGEEHGLPTATLDRSFYEIPDRGMGELARAPQTRVAYMRAHGLELPPPDTDKGMWDFALAERLHDHGLDLGDVERWAASGGLAEAAGIKPPRERLRLFTDDGERRLPHTAQNALRIMKQEPWQGGEGFSGTGLLRAQVTPPFRTLRQIQDARGQLVGRADMSEAKDATNNAVQALYERYAQLAEFDRKGRYLGFDAWLDNMAEAHQRGFDHVGRTYYGGSLPPELVAESRAMLQQLREAPTEYFEAKPRRVVPLGEFAGAVVPESDMRRVAPVLERAGIGQVVPYEGRRDGEGRTQALRAFSDRFFAEGGEVAGLLPEDLRGQIAAYVADTAPQAGIETHPFAHGNVEGYRPYRADALPDDPRVVQRASSGGHQPVLAGGEDRPPTAEGQAALRAVLQPLGETVIDLAVPQSAADVALMAGGPLTRLGGKAVKVGRALAGLGGVEMAGDVAREFGANVPHVLGAGEAEAGRLSRGLHRVMPRENLASGRAAVDRVLREQVSVPAAMLREDLGDVTFDFGQPGNPDRQFRGGSGLSHIRAKRDSEGVDGDAWVREVLPNVLTYGRLERLYGPPIGRRADIVLGSDRVSLSLMRDGKRETWVLTGFPELKGSGLGDVEGVNPSRTYAPEPSGIQATEGARPSSSMGGLSPDVERHVREAAPAPAGRGRGAEPLNPLAKEARPPASEEISGLPPDGEPNSRAFGGLLPRREPLGRKGFGQIAHAGYAGGGLTDDPHCLNMASGGVVPGYAEGGPVDAASSPAPQGGLSPEAQGALDAISMLRLAERATSGA